MTSLQDEENFLDKVLENDPPDRAIEKQFPADSISIFTDAGRKPGQCSLVAAIHVGEDDVTHDNIYDKLVEKVGEFVTGKTCSDKDETPAMLSVIVHLTFGAPSFDFKVENGSLKLVFSSFANPIMSKLLTQKIAG